jgi:CubicO group peptidase (beta-lactamase class C family)
MPANIHLPHSTPEAQGISSGAIIDFINEVDKSAMGLHSIILVRHGQVVAEGWWHPWRRESPHMLFSLSKSFTSTAVGLAIAEGRLSVDDEVLSFFPMDCPKRVSKNLEAMKLRHLLSMSTGHDLDTTERVFRSKNPIRAFLSLPVEHMPGTHWVYNSAASYILSAIVQKLSGQTLLEYLTPRLFEPLGIEGATWESHPNGINFGGWGLSLKTEDIAKFGQFYLQKGEWNGQHILSEWWIDEATQRQVSNGDDPNSDWTQGYGYQYWRCRYNMYRGDGAFGQFCLVMPDQDAVLVITAGVSDMQEVLNLVWEKLLPGMKNDKLTDDEKIAQSLPDRLNSLKFIPPEGASTSPIIEQVSGKTYKFQPNYDTLHSLSFDFGVGVGVLNYRLLGGGMRRGMHRLEFGYGEWREGVSTLGQTRPQKVAASGAWTADNTFTLNICQYETPFILTITSRFEENTIRYDCKANVGFGPLEFQQLVGVR